jgi:hypothetical protein
MALRKRRASLKAAVPTAAFAPSVGFAIVPEAAVSTRVISANIFGSFTKTQKDSGHA